MATKSAVIYFPNNEKYQALLGESMLGAKISISIDYENKVMEIVPLILTYDIEDPDHIIAEVGPHSVESKPGNIVSVTYTGY